MLYNKSKELEYLGRELAVLVLQFESSEGNDDIYKKMLKKAREIVAHG